MTDVPFTGFSATLGSNATAPTRSGSVQRLGIMQQERLLAQQLRRASGRKLQRLMNTLIGAAIGGTAAETRAQVQGVDSTFTVGEFGGVRPVVVNETINRATTQADVDNITELLRRARPPVAYLLAYNETNETTYGNRVNEPYDALLGSTFVLGSAHMVRLP